MKDTTRTTTRATPARRSRRKRPALTVIRSRDLPDVPPDPTSTKPSRAWQMNCTSYLVWPVPAKPGDQLVFNEHGIRRHRRDGPLLERDRDFSRVLTNPELDRLRDVGGLLFLNQLSVNQFASFQLWQTARSMGFDADRLLTPPPRAS